MRPLDIYINLYRTLEELKLATRSVTILEASVYSEKNYTLPKVIVVGTNPSRKSSTSFAFEPDTKSGATVRSWFKDIEGAVLYKNLYNNYTEGNKLPTKSNCATGITRVFGFKSQGYKIVACGAFVHKALTNAGIEHFYMPHPSGLNRFWNDKKAGETKIKEMLDWIKR